MTPIQHYNAKALSVGKMSKNKNTYGTYTVRCGLEKWHGIRKNPDTSEFLNS